MQLECVVGDGIVYYDCTVKRQFRFDFYQGVFFVLFVACAKICNHPVLQPNTKIPDVTYSACLSVSHLSVIGWFV